MRIGSCAWAPLLRALLYVLLAAAFAAAFGWWSMWDCTRDHSGPGEDRLCGVGLVLAVPAFVIGLLVIATIVELAVAARRGLRRRAG